MHFCHRKEILTVVLAVLCIPGMGQKQDTSYYVSYEDLITGRFYFSQKYTSFNYRYPEQEINLRYRPNTTLNMGVGATYKWATLNLAYGFGFLNPNDQKGETKYIDLQVHNYSRKWIIDAYGQIYNGYYLDIESLRDADGNFYHRPDLHAREFGLSANYLFNHERLSYRAAYLQNEWQKKSAGSLLVGWELFFGWASADSSIVPGALDASASVARASNIEFIETGPTVGYAYTWVIARNIFLSGAASLSLDYGRNTIRVGERDEHSSSFSPNSSFRVSGGYNSALWAFSITYVNKTVSLLSSDTERRINVFTGNYRANLVRRFRPSKNTKKQLNRVIP